MVVFPRSSKNDKVRYRDWRKIIVGFIFSIILKQTQLTQFIPSSRSSITSGIFCFFAGFGFLENNDELFLKDEMFSPISLNSLSCSWWAPMTNDEGNPEEVVWGSVDTFITLAPFEGSYTSKCIVIT